MYDFFKGIALENEEKLSEKRVENIKAAALSRVKGENTMKKISAFKTFSIAATIAAAVAMSAMMASAEKPSALPNTAVEPSVKAEAPAKEAPKTENGKTADNKDVSNVEQFNYYVVELDGSITKYNYDILSELLKKAEKEYGEQETFTIYTKNG